MIAMFCDRHIQFKTCSLEKPVLVSLNQRLNICISYLAIMPSAMMLVDRKMDKIAHLKSRKESTAKRKCPCLWSHYNLQATPSSTYGLGGT